MANPTPIPQAVGAAAVPATPEGLITAERQPDPGQKWKCGDEFLPFHPSASHVPADYRDGWNRCYWMSVRRAAHVGEPKPVAWLEFDIHAADGEFPWMLMVNKDHPAIQARRPIVCFATPTGVAADTLHAAILNLPCVVPSYVAGSVEAQVYRNGHRDARHAAAELVVAADESTRAAPDGVQCQAPFGCIDYTRCLFHKRCHSVAASPSGERTSAPAPRSWWPHQCDKEPLGVPRGRACPHCGATEGAPAPEGEK